MKLLTHSLHAPQGYTYTGNTVCALIFAGFIFRGLAIFAFLNPRLLGAVVLKYSRVKYSRIYGAAEVQNLLYSLLDSFEDVIILNGELHSRISHLQGGMEWTPFIGERAWLRPRNKQHSVRCCNEERH